MKICVLDHHGKSFYLAQQLANAGFTTARYADDYDYELLLVDSDSPYAAPYPQKHAVVVEAARRGIPIVLYPHGAPPILDYDGLRPWAAPVSLQLVHGEGHAEIYRRAGCTHRYEIVGWTYGPMRPAALNTIDHLLFAPIHPWADGRNILPIHQYANHRGYLEFLDYPAPRKTVRMWGEDIPNGIHERRPGIDYQQSDLGPATPLIDSADAVLSYGTFAYQALARGKPTVMLDPDPAYLSDDGQTIAVHLNLYRDYARYPAAIGDAPLDDLFRCDVSEWQRLFVGEPLDIEKITRLLRGLRPNRETRRKLARAAR